MRVGCDFYAENAERFLAPETVASDADRSYVRYDPLGPVLAIMPWNFPFWQVFRFAAPGADGGQCRPAQARLERARAARWPSSRSSGSRLSAGRVHDLLVGPVAGRSADRQPGHRAVTLTGSEQAGEAVAAAAGRAAEENRAGAGRLGPVHRPRATPTLRTWPKTAAGRAASTPAKAASPPSGSSSRPPSPRSSTQRSWRP